MSLRLLLAERLVSLQSYLLTCLKYLFGLVLGFTLISCYSYQVLPKEYGKEEFYSHHREAYVLNGDLEMELEILKASKIFLLTADNTAKTRIRLYPIKQIKGCGQPLVLSMLSLGQIPSRLIDNYVFRFDEVTHDTVISRNFDLVIAQHVWFWDLLIFDKKFEEKVGKSLAAHYQNIGRN